MAAFCDRIFTGMVFWKFRAESPWSGKIVDIGKDALAFYFRFHIKDFGDQGGAVKAPSPATLPSFSASTRPAWRAASVKSCKEAITSLPLLA